MSIDLWTSCAYCRANMNMEVLALSNRFSAPSIYHPPATWAAASIDTVSSPYEAGELFGFSYSSQHRLRSQVRPEGSRPRPTTYHGGHSQLGIESPNDLDLDLDPDLSMNSENHDEEPIYQHQGPTIGSLRCLDRAYEHDSNDGTKPLDSPDPVLRLDTTCQSINSARSPLVLVSNFLGTLAALVHTPCSTPVHRKATRRTSAIMIFESEVLVDIVAEETEGLLEEDSAPALSAWASPSMDWEFFMPLSSSESHGLSSTQAVPSSCISC